MLSLVGADVRPVPRTCTSPRRRAVERWSDQRVRNGLWLVELLRISWWWTATPRWLVVASLRVSAYYSCRGPFRSGCGWRRPWPEVAGRKPVRWRRPGGVGKKQKQKQEGASQVQRTSVPPPGPGSRSGSSDGQSVQLPPSGFCQLLAPLATGF
ncbi:MAG: hypothetical protein MZV63_56635 [Marinilabiliales bacterium]|nr:hypothetical protein [Marinilabiliales bacterium]